MLAIKRSARLKYRYLEPFQTICVSLLFAGSSHTECFRQQGYDNALNQFKLGQTGLRFSLKAATPSL